MDLVKIISTAFDSFKRRVPKFLRKGLHDVQTAFEAAPYGIDSNPVKDMIAIYSPTSEKGKTVIIGYLNKNQLAEVGEFRAYSTNAQGALQTYMWLKGNGDILLGGDASHLTKFEELQTSFNELRDFVNNFITTKYNVHTHTYVNVSAPATTSPSTTVGTTTSVTINSAKADKVKTN